MDSTSVGKSTEQIRDSMDSLKSVPVNQEHLGHPVKGTHYHVVDQPRVQDTYIPDSHATPLREQDSQEIRHLHNQGLAEEARRVDGARSEREQLSSEYLKEQLLSDQEKLYQLQSALGKNLTKVEKQQAKLEGKQGVVDRVKDSLVSGYVSAKDKIIGLAPEPVVGDAAGSDGMPGRYHPDPSSLEAGLMTRIGDSVKGGLATAQAGLTSAQTSAQAGLASVQSGVQSSVAAVQSGVAAVQSSAQAGLASAQAGLASVKEKVIGEPLVQTEGMPGRYHPRASELEHHSTGPIWKGSEGGSEVDKDSIDLNEAKSKLEGEFSTVAGMPGPGRNHPNPETLEMPSTGVASKIGDTVMGGLQYAKSTLASAKDQYLGAVTKTAPATAEYPLQARSEIDVASIQPELAKETLEQLLPQKMEGMPGSARYHPHPENLENLGFMDKVKIGLSSAKETAQPYIAAATGAVSEGYVAAKDRMTPSQPIVVEGVLPRSEIDKDSIDTDRAKVTLERTLPQKMEDMPGSARYHPHPENLENLGLMDKVKIGLISAKDTAQPILAAATGAVTGGLIAAKDRLRSHPVAEDVEVLPRSEIEKDSIDADRAKVTLERTLPQKMEDFPGAARYHPHPENLENLGVMDKVKIGLVSAKESAQSTFIAAKDTVTGLIPSRSTPAVMPEARSEIEKKNIDTEAAISTLEQILPQQIEGMPGAGRYHPHPEGLENLSLVDKMKIGLTSVKDSAQAGLSAATGVVTGGLTSAKDSLTSAKDRVIGPTVEPIETGMPGRNHPQPEEFEAPAPGVVATMKSGLESAKSVAQPYVQSAKDTVVPALQSAKETLVPKLQSAKESVGPTLQSAKEAVVPTLLAVRDAITPTPAVSSVHVAPISHTAPVAADSLLITPDSALLNAQASLISAQMGLISAQAGLLAAKERIIEDSVPISVAQPQGPGMMTKLGDSLTSAKDSAQAGLSSAAVTVQPYLASVKDTAQAGLVTAKDAAQAGMAAAPGLVAKAGEKFQEMKSGLVAAKDTIVDSRETTHPGMFLEPVSEVDHRNIDQEAAKDRLEQTLPQEAARNHPDSSSLKARDGLMSQIGAAVTAPLVYAKNTLVGATQPLSRASATVPPTPVESEIIKDPIDQAAVRQSMEETLAVGQIDPLGGVLAPGRNHPDADSLKAHDQGLLSSITDRIKHVFISEK